MARTWTEVERKLLRQARSVNSDDQTQLLEDWNTGYHLFNAELARYYSRKQQFANLVAGQNLYQVPYDCLRVQGITTLVTSNFEPPLTRITDEDKWREITSVKTIKSNWTTYYFPRGNDTVDLWPVPSQSTTNGIRFWYQPQDHDLSIEDVTSASTGFTVTTNATTTTVTANGSAFSSAMAGLYFQVTGVVDLSWYEIVSATATTLTLKTPFSGVSGSGLSWRVGQLSILPQEYADAPMHYALGMYWLSQGNDGRANVHLGTPERPGLFYSMMKACRAAYAVAGMSGLITDATDGVQINPFLITPPASS